MNEILQKMTELNASGTPHVLVTMIDARGEAPADVGAKALMVDSGLYGGTIGGGKVEARVIREAQEMLRNESGKPLLIAWNLQKDIGMTCGGEVTFMFEVFRPQAWKIAIFGAGHVSQALVRALLPLDCRITCIDPRKEWLERLPTTANLSAVLCENPAGWVSKFDKETYFVVMTQGHATDVPILTEIFSLNLEDCYVGAIGSAVKATRLKGDLRKAGVTETKLEKLRCPIGLPFGGNAPAEIAISIAAQLLQERTTRMAPTQASAAPTILFPVG